MQVFNPHKGAFLADLIAQFQKVGGFKGLAYAGCSAFSHPFQCLLRLWIRGCHNAHAFRACVVKEVQKLVTARDVEEFLLERLAITLAKTKIRV